MDHKLMCLCFIMAVVVYKAQPIAAKASPSLFPKLTPNENNPGVYRKSDGLGSVSITRHVANDGSISVSADSVAENGADAIAVADVRCNGGNCREFLYSDVYYN